MTEPTLITTPPLAMPQCSTSSSWAWNVDLRCVVTAIQCDHGTIALAQKLTRGQLIVWVQKQVAAGHSVHTVYEACGFGYTLHYALVAAGAHSIVTTPMQLSPERRRKNDRMDARQLCVRLSRHLDSHVIGFNDMADGLIVRAALTRPPHSLVAPAIVN